MTPGVVVIDNSFVRYLARADEADRVLTNCRAARLEVWPSVVNVLETLKHPNPVRRQRLLDALRQWSGDRPLLPWPPKLLHLATVALKAGRLDFTLRSSQLEYLIRNRGELEADHASALAFVSRIEQSFELAHSSIRSEMQAVLRRGGLQQVWPTARDFIEDSWNAPDNLSHFAGLIGRAIEVEDLPPIEELLRSEAWRITLEAFGTAVYDRTTRTNQIKRPPSQLDLLQLMYLSVHTRRRAFVTGDRALHSAASSVLTGRYPNVRVLRSEEWLSQAA